MNPCYPKNKREQDFFLPPTAAAVARPPRKSYETNVTPSDTEGEISRCQVHSAAQRS